KFNLQAYKDFEYELAHQEVHVDYVKERKNFLKGRYGNGYKKYTILLNKLSAKIEKIDTKVENDIYNILVDSKENVIKNKSKLKKRYYFKAIIKALEFQINERKVLLEKSINA
ncbi:hypothetical protein LR004_02995, partial [Candidatus Gracilibacteria bacterium]|nr:hypothetical protein [Candidatus Gracilibacteria bacterium]